MAAQGMGQHVRTSIIGLEQAEFSAQLENGPRHTLIPSVVSFKYESRGTGTSGISHKESNKKNRILFNTRIWYIRHKSGI